MSTELPTRAVPPPAPAAAFAPRPRARRSWAAKIALLLCAVVLLFSGLAVGGLTVFHNVSPIRVWTIPSGSMEPALKPGNHIVSLARGAHRGDIVIFKAPPLVRTPQIHDLVKRVVGLPGDTIEARGGEVFVDG